LKEEKEKSPVDETKKSGEVTRRDFLVGAGTVVVGGAIGAGLLSSCGETRLQSQRPVPQLPKQRR